MTAHLVALSGGKDSTVMALRLAEVEPRDYIYFCTPTGDELPEMIEHWNNLECILKKPIIKLKAKLDLHGLIAEFSALPNHRQRWCTRMLKIEVAKAFYLKHSPAVAYVGLRADEEARKGGIYGDIVDQKYPMREWGWDINDVKNYLYERNVQIPERTDCARCYEQRLGEWWDLWKIHPELYADAEAQEEKYGHTFRSDTRDTWPASLKLMRARFECGEIPRGARNQEDLFGYNSRCRACSL